MQEDDQWSCFRPCQFVVGIPVRQLDRGHFRVRLGLNQTNLIMVFAVRSGSSRPHTQPL